MKAVRLRVTIKNVLFQEELPGEWLQLWNEATVDFVEIGRNRFRMESVPRPKPKAEAKP